MVLIEPSIGALISQFYHPGRFEDGQLQIGKPATPCFVGISDRLPEMHRYGIACESYRQRSVPSRHHHPIATGYSIG
jgi:hypothetical protein